MFLERLIIIGKDGVIRDIPFNLNGLNLIVDVTPTDDNSTTSGNNVGKTTFIRSLDFCFGSSGRDIYQDKETKSDNENIKNFLVENEVKFILTLLTKNGNKIALQRSFKTEEDLFINNEKYSNLKEYTQKLNQLLFHISSNVSKISFRNIIKKFIRTDANSEANLYKILSSFVNESVYEALYLFLFGFPSQDIISDRLKLIDQIDKQQKELRRIKGKTTLPQLQARFIQLQKYIEEKEEHLKTFDLPKTYDDLINRLKSLKAKTGELSSIVGNLNIKIALSQKTKQELQHNETKVDPKAIHQLYIEAENLLPVVHKSFEEVLQFHNKMIANKIKFVEQHISNLEFERQRDKQELDKLLREQSHVLQLLDNTGTFDDLIKIREEVNILYTEKGKLEHQIDYISNIQQEIDAFKIQLSEVDLKFAGYVDELNSNIENHFNKYFTLYTERTHGEKLYIYYDSEKRKFEFDNIVGNSGDGYKKTEIIAFDLAFISYFDEMGLDFPKFVVHDKLEIIHRNQIQSTFEIADNINGQFVVSVLKERISFLGSDYIESKKILELSQDDKLFKF